MPVEAMPRPLSDTGIAVGPLAFGGTVLGWLVDERTSFALLDAFVDAGFNLIDTADSYYVWAPGLKGGESETIIGKWLKRRGRRDDVVIATKVGEEMGGDAKGLSRRHIERSIEDSLRRLGTDHVDLYQAHVDDPGPPIEETLEAFGRLVEQGKARAIGTSNIRPGRLAKALAASDAIGRSRYRTLQTLYNLHDRADFESGLESLANSARLAVLAYRPLARGFFSGKYRDATDLGRHPRGAGVAQYLDQRGARILAALEEVAAATGASTTQLALAWLIARPSVTAAIAGATSPAQVAELAAATRLALDPEHIRKLDSASDWRAPAA